jgi:hypothetical protein
MIIEPAVFGVLSSLAILVGAGPYIRDIVNKKIHPHVLSWLGWAFITGLGASAMYAEGSTWLAVIVGANTITCLSVVIFSLVAKVAVWKSSKYDSLFFTLGIIGLILWLTLDLPVLALVCAILADFAFGIPTILKTYNEPSTETPFAWSMSTLSGLLSLFAIQTFAFYEVAYPIYLFVFDSVMLLLVLGIIKKK